MKKIFLLVILVSLCSEMLFGQAAYNQQAGQNQSVVMKKKKIREKSTRQSGFQQRLDMGIGFDREDGQAMTLDAAYVYGYQAGKIFFFGVGGGLQVQPIFYDYYLSQKYNLNRPLTVSLPVFLEIKSYLMNRKVSPFIDIRGGYSLGIINSKMTYSRETNYDPANNTDNLDKRIDHYTKNWNATGKFAAIGIGASYKKWDIGLYLPYQYGKYKYTTVIDRYYNDGTSTSESLSAKEKDKRYPIDMQIRVSYKF